MAARKYMGIPKATIQREDLEVFFTRLYEDARDMMSDVARPQWEPCDDFIITIHKVRVWRETQQFGRDATIEIKHTETEDSFKATHVGLQDASVVRMAAKHGATFDEIKKYLERR